MVSILKARGQQPRGCEVNMTSHLLFYGSPVRMFSEALSGFKSQKKNIISWHVAHADYIRK